MLTKVIIECAASCKDVCFYSAVPPVATGATVMLPYNQPGVAFLWWKHFYWPRANV